MEQIYSLQTRGKILFYVAAFICFLSLVGSPVGIIFIITSSINPIKYNPSLNSLKIYSLYPLLNYTSITKELTIISFTNYQSQFIQSFQAEYSKSPGEFTAEAYDAFNALALAIKQDSKSGADIKNRLYLMNFQGASGPVSFDANGDRVPQYKIYKT